MRFLVDAQLPPALADWLRRAGHDADHVQAVGLRNADDDIIRAHARASGAIIITKDRDFAPISQTDVRVLWIRTGNVRTHQLIERISAALPESLRHFDQGAWLVELR